MNINWKVWAPLGIIALVAIVIIGFSKSEAPQAPITGETPSAPVVKEERRDQPIALQPPAGNVDETVNAIIAGAADDQALFADAEKDAALIGADSQAVSDFGQSYDKNEF